MNMNPENFSAAHPSVLRNEPMKLHTTFRIGGPADYFAKPSEEELLPLLSDAGEAGLTVTLIGNGSNLLVSDDGIRGLVISLGTPFSRVIVEGDCLSADAGALLSSAAACAEEHGLSGLEFASGIPGSVGGAVFMNAGAYGGEISQVIKSARVLMPDGNVLVFSPDELDFSYRRSAICENGGIVLSACFQLTPEDQAEIRDRRLSLAEKRREKQPLNYPSAGSTFKRPEGDFAARLIDEAGLSGRSFGGAQVSEKHCGFIINRGDASAEDVISLMRIVRKEVFEKSGILLMPEVRLLGKFQEGL